MLLLLLACSDPPCAPVSTVPIDDGGNAGAGAELARAVQDFVAWSGRDVCVQGLTVDPPVWEEHVVNVRSTDVRHDAFRALCWYADVEEPFANDHLDAFRGVASSIPDPEGAQRDDFSRACERAADGLPWLEVPLQQCDHDVLPRDLALFEFFGEPDAGFPSHPWTETPLGTLPPESRYGAVAATAQHLIQVDWDRLSVVARDLDDLQLQWSEPLPEDASPTLHQGLDDVLVFDTHLGRTWFVGATGLVPGPTLHLDSWARFAQDDTGWWLLTFEGLHRLDEDGPSALVDASIQGVASGPSLWTWDRERRVSNRDHPDIDEGTESLGGLLVVQGGRPYVQAVRYHDVLTFAIGPSGPVLQDVWCDGAYEWTEPRRRYVASASHRLLLEYPFSGWSPNQDVTLHELSW